jgi:hypothetical protein
MSAPLGIDALIQQTVDSANAAIAEATAAAKQAQALIAKAESAIDNINAQATALGPVIASAQALILTVEQKVQSFKLPLGL